MIAVSAVIKACALDAPYLEVMVAHMLRQARYPFAETILLVDPRTTFLGKYARRNTSAVSSFGKVLDRLQASGTISRLVVADADAHADDVCATLGRYFESHVRMEFAHDRTGAPVYSALLGLEVARHDRVLLMDADMLFCSTGPSWVAAGLDLLERDPSLWFVMSHAGPPAGEPGTLASLDAQNRRSAVWDERLGAWCFQHVSTRYFLTDRRRLRGAIPAIEAEDGLEPLEYCLSRALERAAARRANLAFSGNWDLHVHDHDSPFPEWAPRIVQLIERGIVPAQQCADYDLRLRRAAHRIPWRRLLERHFPDFDAFASRSAGGAV